MAGNVVTRKPKGLAEVASDPWGAMRNEMEQFLSKLWGGQSGDWTSGALMPSVDLAESDKALEVRMDLPGMKPEEIDIQLNENILTVSGERKEERETREKSYHRVERHVGKFSRSFTLPRPVNSDEVAAEYKDGVLTITLPKTEEARARRINVKS